MTREIGVGIIGTGFMGACHALAFRAAPAVFESRLGARLEMVADIDAGAAEAAARRFGFARWTDDWRRLVEDPKVDLVAITTPNHLHPEMAIAAAGACKAIYCEKPLAPTLDAARKDGRSGGAGGGRDARRLQLPAQPGDRARGAADRRGGDRPARSISAASSTRTTWPTRRRRSPGAAGGTPPAPGCWATWRRIWWRWRGG